jgi:tetratricopeptide (TPR) repeat protein
MAGEYQEVAINATSTVSTAYMRDGQPGLALQQIYSSVARAPGSAELRFKLGQILLDRRFRKLEEAAANFLLVTQLMPYYDWGHALFGIAMAERGRPEIAYPSLMQALRLNPNNSAARRKLAQISPLLRGQKPSPQPLPVQLEYYPETAPHMLLQGQRDSSGQFIPEGIGVEFYENGRLKRFTDYAEGVRQGSEITWDIDGRKFSQPVNQQGTHGNSRSGK